MKISEVIYELAKIQNEHGGDATISVQDGYLVVLASDDTEKDQNGISFVRTFNIISPVFHSRVG